MIERYPFNGHVYVRLEDVVKLVKAEPSLGASMRPDREWISRHSLLTELVVPRRQGRDERRQDVYLGPGR